MSSKFWEPVVVNGPLFSSSRVEVRNEHIFSIQENRVKVVCRTRCETLCTLGFGSNIEYEVTNFCLHTNCNDVVVSTSNFILVHLKVSDPLFSREFRGHRMPILSLTFDSTDSLVASASADRTVRVWDIERGFCTHCFQEQSVLHSVYFHPNPHLLRLFSVGANNCVTAYDLSQRRTLKVLNDHVGLPTCIDFDLESSVMITCGRDRVLNMYNSVELTLLKTFPIMDELECIMILPESVSTILVPASKGSGFVVLMAGKSGNVFVSHLSVDTRVMTILAQMTLTLPAGISSPQPSIRKLFFLPDYHEIVIATEDDFLVSYDVVALEPANARPTRMLCGNHGDILDMGVISCSDSATSTLKVALITNSPDLRIVDARLNCVILKGHSDMILSIDISPDGLWAVTSSKDGTCRVWNISENICSAVCRGHTEAVGSVSMSSFTGCYSPSAFIFVSGGSDKMLKKWKFSRSKISQNAVVSAELSVRAHDLDINSVSFSPNDSMIASASHDKTVKLWHSSDLSAIATLRGHKRGVWKAVFSPVEKILASCSGDKCVKIWSVVDFSILRTLEGHASSVLTLSFICKGTQLLSGSSDGLIRLWTVRTGESENTFDRHTDKVWCLKTPKSGEDSLYFVSGGSDSQYVIWSNTTEIEEAKRIASVEERVQMEQNLQNHLKNNRYQEALKLSLAIGHPGKVLGILGTVLDLPAAAFSDSGVVMDDIMMTLELPEINVLCQFLRDWNTNSRFTFVSQHLIECLLRCSKARKGMDGFLPDLLAYSERHFDRLDKLHQSSFMLDFASSSISLMPMGEDTHKAKIQKRH